MNMILKFKNIIFCFKYLGLFLLVYPILSFANILNENNKICVIDFYSKIFIRDNILDDIQKGRAVNLKNLFANHNQFCNHENLLTIQELLIEYIKNQRIIDLNSFFKNHSTNLKNISYQKPINVHIYTWSEMLKKTIYPESEITWKNFIEQSSETLFGITEDQTLDVECLNCHSFGQVSLIITIKDASSKENSNSINKPITRYWVSAQKLAKIPVWESKDNIVHGDKSNILKEKLHLVYTETSSPQDFLSTQVDLNFFESTQFISKGEKIKKYRLKTIPLVLSGKPTQIYFVNNGIEIQSTGMSLENGSIHDYIRIKLPSQGKIIQAKVIGQGKVQFDL